MTGLPARIRGHLSFANVTASVALFIALGGTGYAAIQIPRGSVGNSQLQRDAVSASKIRQNAVGKSEIRSGAVGKSEVRSNAIGSSEIRRDAVGSAEVRRGAVGLSEIRTDGVGASEIRADAVGTSELQDGSIALNDLSADTRSAFQPAMPRASVNAGGTAVAGNAKSAVHTGAGAYTVTFASDVSACLPVATLAAVKNGNAVDEPPAGRITVASGGGADVSVKTFNAAGDAADAPFNLVVSC